MCVGKSWQIFTFEKFSWCGHQIGVVVAWLLLSRQKIKLKIGERELQQMKSFIFIISDSSPS